MKGQLTITRGAKWAATGLLVLTLITGGANLWATYAIVQHSQHQWCQVLVTLDQADQHAPPPSTSFGRQLVSDFHRLRSRYGCG